MPRFANKPINRRSSRKRSFKWRSGAAARCLAGIAIAGAGTFMIGQPAQATAISNTAAGNWDSTAIWSPAQVPGILDVVTFALPNQVLLNGNQSVLGLIFSQPTANTTASLRATTAGQILTLGASGITTGANQVDLGGSGVNQMVISMTGDQTWTFGNSFFQFNSGASASSTSVTNSAASGNVTLTMAGAGNGSKSISGAIINGATATTSLAFNLTGGITFNLNGANTYSGGTVITQGLLGLGNNTALGTGAVTFANNAVGKSLAANVVGGVTLTNNNLFNLNGTVTLGGSQNLDLGTGNVTLGSATILSLNATTNPVAYTIGGAIAGAFGLTVSSTGFGINSLINLNGANTSNSTAAPITITGGVVRFGSSAAVPTGVSAVVLNGGSIVVGSGAFTTLASLLSDTRVTKTSGAIALNADSSEAFTSPNANISLGAALGSVVKYTGTLTPFSSAYNVGGGGGTLVVPGTNTFTGNNSLNTNSNSTNGGGGIVVITGQNNFIGATSIGAGTLEVSSIGNYVVANAASSNLGSPTTAANGTINIGNSGQTFSEFRYTGAGETTNRTLNLAGFSGMTTGLDASGTGSLNFGGIFTEASGSTNRFLALRGINTGANTIVGGIGTVGSLGAINLTKQQRGNWTLTGTNNFAGTNASFSGIQINGGSLTADYTINPNILGATATNLTLGGGTLAMLYSGIGTATQTLGNGPVVVGPPAGSSQTILTANTGQSNISVTGNGTPGSALLTLGSNFTRNAGTFLNFNLLNGGQVATSTATVSNSVVVGSSTVAAFTVTDTTGTDFATITGGQIAKLNAATALPTVTGANTANYLLTGSQTQTGATAINTLRISPTASGSTLALGANNGFTTALGSVSILKDGSSDYTITGTISLAASALVLSNFGTGALTVAVPATTGSNSLTKTGPGLVDLTAANVYTGTTNIFGGVLRASNGSFASNSNIVLNTGGILELSGLGDFIRPLGTSGGQVQWGNGDGGFSAYAPSNNGVTRTVTLTNSVGAANGQLVWGSTSGTNFVTTPGISTTFVRDGFALLLSSSTSNTVLNFTNPIDFVNVPRTIQVGDGSSAVDAILSGVLSSSDFSGGLYKTGAGTLALTAVNTYTGATSVNTGVLAVNGSLASGSAVAVASTATLTGTGTVNGSVTTNGTINPGTVGAVGTLTMGALTFSTGSKFTVDLGAGAANTDKLIINGAATIASGALITFNQLTTPNQGNYLLATATSGLNSNAFTGAVPTAYHLASTATALNLTHGAVAAITATTANQNVHVGSTAPVGVTVSNTAPTGSDALTYNLTGAFTGSNVTGLAPSGSEVKNGTSPVAVVGVNNLTETATPTGAFAAATNGAVSTNFTVTGYRLAAPNTLAAINFGNYHVGTTLTSAQSLLNGAANDGFSEGLVGTLSSTSGGATVSGVPTATIAAGSSATLTFGLGNGAGVQSGSVVIGLTSDGTGTSGLGVTGLGTQTVNLSGTGFNLASASVTPTPVNLGNIRAGSSFGTQALSITNIGPGGGYTEGLNATAATTPDATSTGSITNLSAGSSSTAITVGLGSGAQTAGAKSGLVNLSFTSNGTIDSLSNTTLAGQSVSVSGNVYSGMATYAATGSSDYVTGTNATFQSQWSDGGAPGIDGVTGVDTATFGSSITAPATVTINSVTPDLASVTFSSANSYTLAASGSGSLTLDGGGGSATLSDTSGNHTVSAPITLATDATVNVTNSADALTDTGAVSGSHVVTKTGAGTLVLAAANNYNGGTVVNAGTISAVTSGYSTGTITVNSGATVDYTQGSAGSAGNNISGAGRVTFGGYTSGANGSGGTITYTGQDTAGSVDNTNPSVPVVNGGTIINGVVVLSRSGGAAVTGPVAVASGGVLSLGSDDQVSQPSTSAFVFSGGTLAASGHSEGSPTTAALGRLLLTSGVSTLDFGDTMVGLTQVPGLNTLAFADSSGLTWTGTLQLTNYTDGLDMLYIGSTNSLNSTQLGQITFNGTGATQLPSGQIVFTPIPAPEPSGWVSMLAGVGVLGSVIARRRRQGTVSAQAV